MPSFGPIKRGDLIRYLRKAGFDGPYSGGKHQLNDQSESNDKAAQSSPY
jgi:hypothetical protein